MQQGEKGIRDRKPEASGDLIGSKRALEEWVRNNLSDKEGQEIEEGNDPRNVTDGSPREEECEARRMVKNDEF